MTLSEQYPADMLPVRVIPLTQGQFAIIDPEDYETVSGYKWHVKRDLNTSYAITNVPIPGKTITVLNRSGSFGEWQARTVMHMHTLLTGFPMTDHIQGNGLDNRRVNMREATTAENVRNRRVAANNTSGVTGVSWNRNNNNWRAHIRLNGSRYDLGSYANKADAIKARIEAEKLLFGEFRKVTRG